MTKRERMATMMVDVCRLQGVAGAKMVIEEMVTELTKQFAAELDAAVEKEREACAALMDAKSREHERLAQEFVGKDMDMACEHRSMSGTYAYAASDIRARSEREVKG